MNNRSVWLNFKVMVIIKYDTNFIKKWHEQFDFLIIGL